MLNIENLLENGLRSDGDKNESLISIMKWNEKLSLYGTMEKDAHFSLV